MNNKKESKNFHTLDMHVRLYEGKTINEAEGARRFGVDERSIQRDIENISVFLDECSMSSSSAVSDISCHRNQMRILDYWGKS